MDCKNEIYAKNWVKRTWTRNGNGSGLDQVFSYSNPARGPDLGHLLNRFFFQGRDPPPHAEPYLGQPDLGQSVAQPKKKELNPKQSPNENLITV